MLSTLDWALIETWREAGVPLEAVLRGIDAAFDKHDAKTMSAKGRTRKVNGLAWCAQSVMEAVELAKEASIGAAAPSTKEPVDTGFEAARIAAYMEENAAKIEAAALRAPADGVAAEVVAAAARIGDDCANRSRGITGGVGPHVERAGGKDICCPADGRA